MAKDRPHGHLGAASTKVAADRAVLRSHFGPYYQFVQRLGGLPVIYFVLAGVAYRSIWHAIGAGIYAFLFHLYATSYFAARSKMGLESCPTRSAGHFWSRIFVARAVFDHVVMMSALIWAGPLWFLGSGVILYVLDYAITMSTTLRWCIADKKDAGRAGGKKK
jgi:hypothetical protein